MPKPTTTLLQSFGYAFAGIKAGLSGRNAKIELAIGVLAVLLGVFLGCSVFEWLILVVFIFLVLAGECANSALEAVVDLASPGVHPLAKVAKDMSAGAVLILALGSLVAAALIFVPKILSLIG